MIAALTLGLALAAQPEVEVDEVPIGYDATIRQLVETGNWVDLFAEYRAVLDAPEKRRQVVPLGDTLWQSVVTFFHDEFRGLPPEAWAYYRRRFDAEPRYLFQQRRAGDDRPLLTIVEDHFFSSVGDLAAVILANEWAEQGLRDDAADLLLRVLRWTPNPASPRHLLAARAAHDYALAGNAAGLEAIAALLAENPSLGMSRIVAGGRSLRLSEWVEELSRRAAVPAPAPTERLGNELLLYRYRFDDPFDPTAPSIVPPTTAGPSIPGRIPGSTVRPAYIAALAKVGSREVILATNGAAVAALSALSGRTFWIARPPPGRTSAAPPTNIYYYNPQAGTPPQTIGGCTVEGHEAFFLVPARADLSGGAGSNAPGALPVRPLERVVAYQFYDPRKGAVVGRPLWDTDAHFDALVELLADNWTFTHPPVVIGRNVLLPVTASRGTLLESYVLALDRRTGKPNWLTFVAAAVAGPPNAMVMHTQPGSYPVGLTMFRARGGVLYVATHLGAVAAVRAVDGSILWLRSYPRGQGTVLQALAGRVPTFPELVGGKLHVLPMDALALLRFRPGDGMPEPVPTGGVDWRGLAGILAADDRHLLLGSTLRMETKSVIFDTATEQYQECYVLSPHTGYLGTAYGGVAYVPAVEQGTPNLKMVDFLTKRLERGGVPWADPGDGGHIVVTGDFLITCTESLNVYAGVAALRRVYAGRIEREPEALWEYAGYLQKAGVLDESAEMYRRYLTWAEREPSMADRVGPARRRVFEVFLNIGKKDRAEQLWDAALEHLETARSFAPDDAARAQATLEIAGARASRGDVREAVREYAEALRIAPSALVPAAGSGLEALWHAVRRELERLIRESPDAAQAAAQEIQRALESLAPDDPRAWREILRRFPFDPGVRQRVRERLLEWWGAGRVAETLPVYRALAEVEPDAGGDELGSLLVEWYRQGGEAARARAAWRRLRDPGPEPEFPAPEDPPPGTGPVLSLVAEWSGDVDPLALLGWQPASLPADWVLVAEVGVAARQVPGGERVWERAPPAGVPQAIRKAVFGLDGVLVVPWERMIVGLDPSTGDARWAFTPPMGDAVVRDIAPGWGRVYVLYERPGEVPPEVKELAWIAALEDATGEPQWVVPAPERGGALRGSPDWDGVVWSRWSLEQAGTVGGAVPWAGPLGLRSYSAGDGAVLLDLGPAQPAASHWTIDGAEGVVYVARSDGSLEGRSLGVGRVATGWQASARLPAAGAVRVAAGGGRVAVFAGTVAEVFERTERELDSVRRVELPAGIRYPEAAIWGEPSFVGPGRVVVDARSQGTARPDGRLLFLDLRTSEGAWPVSYFGTPGRPYVLSGLRRHILVGGPASENSAVALLQPIDLRSLRLMAPEIRSVAMTLGTPRAHVHGNRVLVRTAGSLQVWE